MLGTVTHPANDSLGRIIFDAAICTACIGGSAGIVGALNTFCLAEEVKSSACVYLPTWCFFCLSAAYYARWRGRLAFDWRDIVWALPTVLVLGLTLDLVGSSILVPIIGFATYAISNIFRRST